MSHDSLLEKLILNHCWQTYEILYSNFTPAARFSSEFLSAVELAVVTNLFQLSIEIDAAKHVLHIREEWKSEDYKLTVLSYSYNLLDKDKHTIIRADSLPHHKVDYKGHPLAYFPHHIHDRKGRICSFSGNLHDFVMKCLDILSV